MAQRRSSKPESGQSNTEQKPSASVAAGPELASAWKRFKEIAQTQRFKSICAIVLLAFVLFTLIAMISFIFVGNADFSISSQPLSYRFAHHGEIKNVMGIIGSDLVYALVCRSFGWASIAFLVFMVIVAVDLLGKKQSLLRAFFASSFWLIWGSIVLSLIPLKSLNYSLGGAHGLYVSEYLKSLLHPLGTILVLIAILIIFLIAIDKDTIPRCKSAWQWLKDKLSRKRQEPIETPSDTEISEQTPAEGHTDESVTDDDDQIVALDPDDDTLVLDISDVSDQPSESAPVPQEPDDNFVIVDTAGSEQTTDDDATDQANNAAGGSDDLPAEEAEEQQTSESDKTGDLDMDIEVNYEEILSKDPDYFLRKLGPYDPHLDLSRYTFPSISLLKTYPNESTPVIDMDEQQANKALIVRTFRSFSIEIVSIRATIGPTVTLYEIVPKEGTRINRIQTLEKDIMLSLSANGIRIIAPIPGKGTVGIEVPNKKPQIVSMHSVIASKRFQEEKKMHLPVVIGKTITNEVFMFDLAKTPHLLVAGATGQGKSVGLNAIITSLLYKKHPTELKFVLVDPKMVEFTLFEPLIRHYMAAMPDQEEIIITDCQKVINTLNSLVIEMEDRYMLLMDAHVRNLEDYNEKFVNRRLNPTKEVKNSHGGTQHHRFLPYLVIIIDEFGDFIMQAGKQVETPIARITQKARAVGMHMILATQRPSVNIVTGVIKANIPTRIAFRTQSMIDSRTVLDSKGAEGLVGKGDMLYSGGTELTRIQCAFVDTPEVENIVKYISEQQHFSVPYQLPEYVGEGEEGEALAPGSVDLKRLDPMFKEVATYVVTKQEGSTSKLQRAFEIGYNRAGKLSDQLEAAGIVGPNKGPKGRDVLVQDMTQLAQILEDLGL